MPLEINIEIIYNSSCTFRQCKVTAIRNVLQSIENITSSKINSPTPSEMMVELIDGERSNKEEQLEISLSTEESPKEILSSSEEVNLATASEVIIEVPLPSGLINEGASNKEVYVETPLPSTSQIESAKQILSSSEEEGHKMYGRRVVDLDHLFTQIFNNDSHKPFDCNMVVEN